MVKKIPKNKFKLNPRFAKSNDKPNTKPKGDFFVNKINSPKIPSIIQIMKLTKLLTVDQMIVKKSGLSYV